MNKIVEDFEPKTLGRIPEVHINDYRGIAMSFGLIVLLPVILFAAYYELYAVPIYETEARVAVRKEAVVSTDSVGVSLGSASALAVFADSFIVAEFAKTHKAVETIMKKIDLGAIFSKGNEDPLYAYPDQASLEETVEYWKNMVDADFDASTGIIILKVRAFAPDDALKIANELVHLLEKLVAKLSEKSQREAVRYAEVILEKATGDLARHRLAVQNFRIKNEIVDPSSEVANLNALITTLSQKLIELKTERAVMRATSINNPKVRQLDIKIKNTLKIIGEIKKGQADFKYVGKLPSLLRSYELLRTNYEVANQQYTKALDQLGEANASAILRQAHLYIFAPFIKPQLPVRPDMPLDLLKIMLICFSVWAIYRFAV